MCKWRRAGETDVAESDASRGCTGNMRVAMAIVLDRSGSMAVPVAGGKTKMDLANLGTADLRDANLREANLRYTKLRGATLEGACLCGADLSEADIADAAFANAHYDAATKLPDGLDATSAGMILTGP